MDKEKKISIPVVHNKVTLILVTGTTLKWNDRKNVFQANGTKKQVGFTILISYKTNFNLKLVSINKIWYFILIKGTVTWEDIVKLNICTWNSDSISFTKSLP